MVMKLLALVMILSLAGCAGTAVRTVVTDLTPDVLAQAQVLRGSLPLLPPDDPWLTCNAALQTLGGLLLAGPGLEVQGGGVLTEAARLHVLDSLVQNLPPAIKQSCGEVLMSLLLRAGSRLPGL